MDTTSAVTMSDRLYEIVYLSHLAAMNGGKHVENELNELNDTLTTLERKLGMR